MPKCGTCNKDCETTVSLEAGGKSTPKVCSDCFSAAARGAGGTRVTTEIEGKVLRALAPLVLKPKESGRKGMMSLHLRPVVNLEGGGDWKEGTLVEVTDGCHFIQVRVPGACDRAVFLNQDDANRIGTAEMMELQGTHVVKPFELPLEHDGAYRGSVEEDLTFPALDEIRPEGRGAFSVNPLRLAKVLAAFHKVGCASVEVVLPKTKGGLVGLRGHAILNDERVEVVAGVALMDMFNETT